MLLRNYDNLFILKNSPFISDGGADIGKDAVFGDEHLGLKSTSNLQFSLWAGGYNYYYCKDAPLSRFTKGANLYSNTISDYNNLICGDSNQAVTYDDYKLGNIISNSNLQVISHSTEPFIYDEATKTYTRIYKKVFCAINKDVVIREIGITKPELYSSSTAYPVLLYRKVFDGDGIVVPANGTVVITFTTTFLANSNKPIEYNASATLVE